jgi:hypothetical protein
MERLEQPPGALRSSVSLRSLRRKDENDGFTSCSDGKLFHLFYRSIHWQ